MTDKRRQIQGSTKLLFLGEAFHWNLIKRRKGVRVDETFNLRTEMKEIGKGRCQIRKAMISYLIPDGNEGHFQIRSTSLARDFLKRLSRISNLLIHSSSGDNP